MKRSELILGAIAFMLLLVLVGKSWLIIMKIFIGLSIICSVLHWKISPFNGLLSSNYAKFFDVVDSVMKVFLIPLNRIPNIQLGNRIQLDMSYVTIIGVLTIILIIL